jgi:rhomboid family GlyGly-CTERM serine protease
LFAAGAVLGWFLPASALIYDTARNAHEPWRWWTPVAVHLSLLHLAANGAGSLAVGAVGLAGRVPPRTALAWVLAWPLTHAGLVLAPDLLRYAGLSGVLHAGVAVLGVHLLVRPGDGDPDPQRRTRRRLVGLALLVVLAAKVLAEQPFAGPAARAVDGWDIAVAPVAHAVGALAGLLAALAVEIGSAWRHAHRDGAATLRG